MSSSTPLSVLILGATGTLGANIANGFLLPQYATKATVSLLVRESTATVSGPKKDALDAFVRKGAKLIFGDIFSPQPELVKAFTGIDVIVSALGPVVGPQLPQQVALVAAAKAAGVRWFVPSEFGSDGEGIGRGSPVPMFDVKLEVSDAVRASGLDYTFVLVGGFIEFLVTPFFGVDVEKGVITAPGSFDVGLNVTPLADVGIQTADAIITGRGRNQTIFLGETVTFGQVADTLERVTGKKLVRKVVTAAQAEAAIAADQNDYIARFALLYSKVDSKYFVFPKEKTYAAKYGIKQSTFEEFAQKNFKPAK